VVLDEPMSGLDPIGRKEVRDLILELRRRGKTVFFSTHILPDVEALADRVGVILGGRLRDVGRISDLLSPRIRSVEVVADVPGGAAEAVSRGRIVSRDEERLGLSFPDLDSANAAVSGVLAAGGEVVSFVPHRETLEDFFVRRLEEGKAAGQSGRAPETR
jgi:ABC-2 type transport system ATP-binding protein